MQGGLHRKTGLSKPENSIPFFILGLIWWFTKEDYFFWDTVQLASKQAHYFYENGYQELILPPDIDSGHFPMMGIYLSLCWLAFGKTLLISHVAMVPWLFVIAFNIAHLGSYYFSSKIRSYAILIISLQPTLLAQAGIVSPDIILVAAFLSCITFYNKKQNILLSVALLILSMISMRGAITTVALVAALFWFEWTENKSLNYKIWLQVILPSLLCNVIFFTYHFYHQHWVGFHESSPWAQSFEQVSFMGWIKNLIVLGWRFVDFGFVGMWVLLLYFIFKIPVFTRTPHVHFWYKILIVLTGVFVMTTSVFQGLTSHRYFLPVYLATGFLTLLGIENTKWNLLQKKFVMTVLGIILISGHFWRYPDKMAQGWDASLAYKPVFTVWDSTRNFLATNHIQPEKVASFFPFLSAEKFTHLTVSTSAFRDYNTNQTPYLFLSNITNDAPDSLYTIYPWENALYYIEKGSIRAGIFVRK